MAKEICLVRVDRRTLLGVARSGEALAAAGKLSRMVDEPPDLRPKPFLATAVLGIDPEIDPAVLTDHVGVESGRV